MKRHEGSRRLWSDFDRAHDGGGGGSRSGGGNGCLIAVVGLCLLLTIGASVVLS